LLRVFAQEYDVLDRPWPFADETARLECCRDRDRDPRFATGTPQQGPTVTILSGLPATGKSTLAAALDAQRISIEDLMDGGMERGSAVQAGRERLRQALRERRDAVWDATMLTRTLRRQLVSLAEDYGARCVIRVCELPQRERAARNAERANPVPDAAVAGMLTAWEMPTFDEALVIEGRPARL
ncbi:MAG: ATP-binding protein, partial [Pseudomonadota bacterium]